MQIKNVAIFVGVVFSNCLTKFTLSLGSGIGHLILRIILSQTGNIRVQYQSAWHILRDSRDWEQSCCPSVQHEMGLILTRGGAQPKAHKLKVRIGHMYLAVPRLSQTKFLNYDPAMSYTAEFRAVCASHQI